MRKGNVGIATRQINALTETTGFYDKVREIVGFYDDALWWEDYEIKKLQRIADARYSKLSKCN